MAEDDNDSEKTEEPSGRKLEKAREEGNVSKSQEVSSTLLLIIVFIFVYMYGGSIVDQSKDLFVEFFMAIDQPVFNTDQAIYFSHRAAIFGLLMAGPPILMMVAIGILANIVQTGPVFSLKVMEFKGSRISPLAGFKRVFSTRGLVELVKGLLKITIISIVIWNTVSGNMDSFINMCLQPLGTIMTETGNWTVLLMGRILALLLILSIGDALYQRFQYHKDLRMTKQEVKDEYKQMEGDGQVKSQRRRLALKRIKKRRLDHAVLNSNVVITNPTHYAVAIRYDPEQSQAPVIMAKGTRLRALKIREFAARYDVPVIENPPVARALFATGEEDQMIPVELYQAVAEILAVVFKNQKKQKKPS
jgi:flagellar biosynthetic protein FlhB